jgi:hypothetical protein
MKNFEFNFYLVENNKIAGTKTVVATGTDEAEALSEAAKSLSGYDFRYTGKFKFLGTPENPGTPEIPETQENPETPDGDKDIKSPKGRK